MNLKRFKNSSLANIKITYGNEVHRFNLIEITTISEVTIEKELKRQASYYGFCLLLQKKLTTQFERLKHERKKLYGRLYHKAKEQLKSNTGRGYSDEGAKAYVLHNKEYVRLTEACIEAKDNADTLYAVVRALEQRKDLMQTISSNKRKEF
jgi:hypothetical protein